MDPGSARGERAERLALAEKRIALFYWAGALILTLAVRVYLFTNYYTINNDGIFYIEAARNFWGGKWDQGLASFYPPGFPLMIAAAYGLVGNWELAGQFWPFVLGIFILFPLFGLLRRSFGMRVAQLALFFYGVSPYLARLSLHVRSEIPYIFFLLLALYLLQRGMDKGGLFYFLLTGICSGLAYLIRPEGMGLIIVGALFIVYQGWLLARLERSWLRLAALVLGFVVFSAPYILYLRWDTGHWLVSRKAGYILSLALAKHDPETELVAVEESERLSVVRMISSHPLAYARKVFIDAFRSLGFYFEAIHYSYLPFLFLGWVFFFRGRFWEREEFLLAVTILFYLAGFSLLYMNRRYGVPLATLSLGWVGVGYLALKGYFYKRWDKTGTALTAIVLLVFLVGTLPKTLQAIGKEKFYLREAAAYLKNRPGNPSIVTNNARVAFYADGQNRILLKDSNDLLSLITSSDGDYFALDRQTYRRTEALFKQQGWRLDREFSGGDREGLFVLRREAAPWQ